MNLLSKFINFQIKFSHLKPFDTEVKAPKIFLAFLPGAGGVSSPLTEIIFLCAYELEIILYMANEAGWVVEILHNITFYGH